ncbi:MAG: hypothetical protein ACRDLT_01235 [Solirubrobacteraceae bacterium]
MQSAGADPVGQSVPTNSCSPELVDVKMTVLQLREARHFGVTRPTNRLKPANCAA